MQSKFNRAAIQSTKFLRELIFLARCINFKCILKKRSLILKIFGLVFFVLMDTFPKEGSWYPIWDFASRVGIEQTFLLP